VNVLKDAANSLLGEQEFGHLLPSSARSRVRLEEVDLTALLTFTNDTLGSCIPSYLSVQHLSLRMIRNKSSSERKTQRSSILYGLV
jgi:hypothetical protein